MQTIKIAVAGTGAIANVMHLPGIKTMEEMGLVELVAICDIFEEKAQATAERFGAPRYFTSLDTMLEEADFDLLVNTTVIPSHFAVTLAALEAGKHVYTQKPMATTLDEATQLIETAQTHGVRLGVAPEHRVRPHVQKMTELIAQGAANMGAALFGGFCVTGTIASAGGCTTNEILSRLLQKDSVVGATQWHGAASRFWTTSIS